MTKSKLVVAAFAALSLTAGNAFAQDEGDPCGDPCAGDPCAGDPCGGGDGTGAAPDDGSGAMEEGAEGIAGYPQAVIDRPRVLPKGVLEATADVGIARISIEGLGSATGVGLGLSGRYGIAPKLDATLSYGFSLKEFEIKGDLGLDVQYSLAESEKMGVAARVSTGYSVVGEAFSGVALGLNLIYRVTPKIGVGTNGGHLVLGFADGVKPVSLNLPVQVEFQANEKINVFLATQIATIGLSPSGTAIIGRDGIPLTVGGSFSPSNKLDIGAAFTAPDLEFLADIFVVDIFARIRM